MANGSVSCANVPSYYILGFPSSQVYTVSSITDLTQGDCGFYYPCGRPTGSCLASGQLYDPLCALLSSNYPLLSVSQDPYYFCLPTANLRVVYRVCLCSVQVPITSNNPLHPSLLWSPSCLNLLVVSFNLSAKQRPR